jgi:uncharacterized protein
MRCACACWAAATAAEPPYVVQGDGVILTVRVTPRTSRTEATGLHTLPDGRTALSVRLAAPPVDGAANTALVKWAADTLAVPRSAVTLQSGDTSRIKRLRITGDAAGVVSRVNALTAAIDAAPRSMRQPGRMGS